METARYALVAAMGVIVPDNIWIWPLANGTMSDW